MKERSHFRGPANPTAPSVLIVAVIAWTGWLGIAAVAAIFPRWASLPLVVLAAGCMVALITLIEGQPDGRSDLSYRHLFLPTVVTGVAAWRVVGQALS